MSTTNRSGNDEAPPNGENGRRIRLAFARPPRAVRAAARWAGASFLHARVTPESSARQASAARGGLLLLALGLAAIPSAALNAPGFAAVTLSACGGGVDPKMQPRDGSADSVVQSGGTGTTGPTSPEGANGADDQPPKPVLEPSSCPDDGSNCVVARGRVLYVEKVDPDGDGDAHFVTTSSQSVTLPGITIFDVRAVDYHSKPDPHAYSKVLNTLGLPGEACVMLDDQASYLAGAARAGMRTIWVREGGTATDGIDYAVDHVLDSGPILRRLLGLQA